MAKKYPNGWFNMRREALFPKLINDMGIDIGVEVGVSGGLHAMNLLNRSNISKLYLIILIS